MTKLHSSAYVQYPSTWRKQRSTFFCIFFTLGIGVLTSPHHVSASAIGAKVDVKGDTLRSTAKRLADEGSLNAVDTIVKPGPNGTICLKPECIHTASYVLKSMDATMKPCDNFYKFACGGFEKSNIIPDSKSQINSFLAVWDNVQEQLRLSFEEKISKNDLQPFKVIKRIYKACADESAIEAAGLEPLRKILEKLNGWPVLEGDRWNETNFSWTKFIHKCRKLGFYGDYLIRLDKNINPKNTSKMIAILDQADLQIDREYLVKGLTEPAIQAYYKYMVDIALLMGAKRNSCEAELKEALEFQINLAKISLRIQDRRNATLLYNPMSLAELMGNYSSIPWREFIKYCLSSNMVIRDDQMFLVYVPSYVAKLEELLKVTPKRVVANYLIWTVVTLSTRYLNSDARKLHQDFQAALYGNTASSPRWKYCVSYISSQLRISTSAMYVRKHLNKESKKSVTAMTTDIKNQVIKILNETEWMDEITRKRAIDKAKAIKSYVAYPEELFDDSIMETVNEDLEIYDGSYFDTILNLTRYQMDFIQYDLRQHFRLNGWTTHAYTAIVNAFYKLKKNAMELPAGILQGAFFNNDRPRYMNYGAIGSIIGHEMTHAFDNQGRQYDKNGNLRNWWKPRTAENFEKRAQCITDQYGNYTVEEVGLNLDGKKTQGENIADNGGTKQAYMAYINWVARNGEEQKLPGVPYTPNQLFWISMAIPWCTKYNKKSLRDAVLTDVHPPAQYRINGRVSNSEAFAKDFGCPIGSKMNPVKKCVVW